MNDYSEASRTDLLQRIEELEAQLQRAVSGHSDALKDSESRIRAILDTAVEGIITIDERGLIESLNPAAERLFGYSREEVIGRNVSLLMPAPYKDEHDQYMHNYLSTGKRKIIGIGREVVGQRQDGSVFPMDLSVGELNVAGRRLFTGIVRDITGRKRTELQLEEMARTLTEKNKELETIVYVASHDLRSPLVNIQGFSKELAHSCKDVRQLLAEKIKQLPPDLEEILAHDVPEAISYILAGVNKIDTLLAGFLRFSRLGRAALKIERVNMQALVANVLRTIEFQLKESGAQVKVNSLPPCTGDQVQLTQVITNLLDNALKYRAPNRTLQLEISGQVEGDRATYAFKDNGVGIAPEHQEKVFEIFHRLNPTQSEGEGLGLTIAQRSLERQNGRIRVESRAGEGSTFFISLPRAGK